MNSTEKPQKVSNIEGLVVTTCGTLRTLRTRRPTSREATLWGNIFRGIGIHESAEEPLPRCLARRGSRAEYALVVGGPFFD
jgi:hypothetical protein